MDSSLMSAKEKSACNIVSFTNSSSAGISQIAKSINLSVKLAVFNETFFNKLTLNTRRSKHRQLYRIFLIPCRLHYKSTDRNVESQIYRPGSSTMAEGFLPLSPATVTNCGVAMRPVTRSLHWHNSPTGTEPHPANLSITPAGSQLQSSQLGNIYESPSDLDEQLTLDDLKDSSYYPCQNMFHNRQGYPRNAATATMFCHNHWISPMSRDLDAYSPSLESVSSEEF
uniref:Uncharacterized protein n=1 Tax=Glossina pallidipes TaxID=7398 RepID=A0A1A9Z2N0_GLOPL